MLPHINTDCSRMVNPSMPEDRLVRETLATFAKICEQTHKEDSDLQAIETMPDGAEKAVQKPRRLTSGSKNADSLERRCLNFLDIPLAHGTVDVR